MTNKEVVQAWKDGKKGKAGSLTTDGIYLWSYHLKIGMTGQDGYKYIANYTARDDKGCFGYKTKHCFVSQTTSTHIGLARRVAYSIDFDSIIQEKGEDN